jgi:hypothetical protein
VLAWDSESLPSLLASVVRKMMLAKQAPAEGDQPTVVRRTNATTSCWKTATRTSLNFNLSISRRVRNFNMWEDLGKGADGRAFLVSGGTSQAVGVLKFFAKDPQFSAQKEAGIWQRVYSHLAPIDSVRVVKVMSHHALLMPWFQSPTRDEDTLEAICTTLKEDYQENGLMHGDVAWRNVGVYRHNGKTAAVVFDMQSVVSKAQDDAWINEARQKLRMNIM